MSIIAISTLSKLSVRLGPGEVVDRHGSERAHADHQRRFALFLEFGLVDLASVSAADVTLLTWMGPLSSTMTTGLVGVPGLEP